MSQKAIPKIIGFNTFILKKYLILKKDLKFVKIMANSR